MLPTRLIHAIAREMKAAQDGVLQVELLTTRYPGFDLPTAYAVANLVHEARLAEGARPVGRKIGFTNPAMWSLFGVREPIWGHMYDFTVFRMPQGQGTCSLHRFAEPKIEPEIVFHFQSTPPVGGDVSRILDCIDWVAHGFEIVQSHFPGWKFQAADAVADWALHGSLLLGEPQPVARLGADTASSLKSLALALACNAQVRDSGKGSNVLGSPLAAIAYLIEVLAKQPQYRPLQAGELVTTGTITPAQPVSPGETWATELSGIALPGLSVEFIE